MNESLAAVLMIIGLISGGSVIALGIVNNSTQKTIVTSGVNVEEKQVDYSQFQEPALSKDNIKLKFENKELDLTLPIFYETNRYYLPITEIISKINGKQILNDNSLTLELGNITQTIDLKENTYRNNDQLYHLKKKSLISGGVVYLSMFDFNKLFNLKVDWVTDSKTLSFYSNRDNKVRQVRLAEGKPALIRFEDISTYHLYTSTESLEKLRLVSDFLYQENVPFHVAWVPRYIDPRSSPMIDIDISKTYSIENANFVYTLDYMLDRDGLIGLHGYTHQYENSVSIEGIEFHAPYAKKLNPPDTEEYAQERVNLAKEAAQNLEIPYAFFEAPHYAISAKQLRVIENNFDNIYEEYSGSPNQMVERRHGEKMTKYFPTPLNYVDGKNDVNRMINKIRKLRPDVLASFFYDPNLEFESIVLSKEPDGYPTYTYSTSVLHQLLEVFREKGYRFEKITELN